MDADLLARTRIFSTMKSFRISASILTLAALSLLAACGGGGGGGGTPPIGGGGGGPTPTPHASSTPTVTPTPTATSTPTGSVAVNTGYTITAEENFGPYGALWYTSGTASWSNTAGDTAASAANVANGNAADSMTCANTVEGATFPQTAYSQHSFVGIFDSTGTQQALPQALGMVNPVAPTAGTPSHPSNTYEVEQYQCEYQVHTHDYSGLVHIEDVNLPQDTSLQYAPSYATLQALLDLWGASLSSNGLTAGSNSLSGAVTIYVGSPSSKATCGNAMCDLVNSYSVYNGSAGSLLLKRHQAAWIVVGTTAANIPAKSGQSPPIKGLPQVEFVLQN
jgi:hypothetical protein